MRAGIGEDTTVDVGMRSEMKSMDSATNAADATLATGWSIQEDLQRQRALFDNMMGSIDQVMALQISCYFAPFFLLFKSWDRSIFL